MDALLWFLLPVAAVCGWFAARNTLRPNPGEQLNAGLRADYFKGIDYLLNEQQDKALDVFIKVLEVDAATAETHLALGNLYRRRGEVDRAIRIHQNLVARSELDESRRVEALLELGHDYQSAGLLDRAEDLFRELVHGQHYCVQALRQLIDIYEQEKDWQKAADAAHDLERQTGSALGAVIAHYWCELAEKARAEGDAELAQSYLSAALKACAACVRASILRGDLLFAAGDGAGALQAYRQVEQQDADYLPEVIERLLKTAESTHLQPELIEYLHHIVKQYGGISATLALAELTEREAGRSAAAEFMTEQLRKRPTIRGFERLLALKADATEETPYAGMLQVLVEQLMTNRPAYKCGHCGFPARLLHWQCPGCKHWNTVKPIQGVEGE
mgnify:CR=1 FL=1|jgi:lipopolysaccharide assembly protein B